MKYLDNFDDEVICDFLVTADMKKVWACQMEMLDKLDEICKKYNISYFADSGTLIGAIRHKGYIPWDDDIDIVMKREDYNKFLEVAQSELNDYLFLQTVYTDSGYFRGHAQIRNSNTTGILIAEEKAKYKFNQGIFIDIFPLDELPDNKFLLKLQLFRMKVLKFIMLFGYQKLSFEKGKKLRNVILGTLIIPFICKLIVKLFGFKRVFRRFEKISSKYNGKNNKYVSYISYSLGAKKHIWEAKCFESALRVPFENMEIDIPVGYDCRLRTEYNDYMKIVKASTMHGEVIFDTNVSYVDYLNRGDD